MDRQAIVGFVLIAVVLVVWMTINAPPSAGPGTPMDSSSIASQVAPSYEPKAPVEQNEAPIMQDSLGRFFSGASRGQQKVLIIETDLFVAEITTKGGLLRKWDLKEYKTWDKLPVQLIDFDQGGDFSLLFNSSDGKLINTHNLFYRAAFDPWQHVILKGNDSISVDLVLSASNGGRIVKTLTFKNGSYSFDASLKFERMDEVISGFEYQVVWEHGLRYAEQNSIDESSFAMAYASAGGELAEIDAGGSGEPLKSNISGTTDWVAARNKYFAVAILPRQKKSEGAYLEGTSRKMPDSGLKESYYIGLRMPFRAAEVEQASFTVFLGPLDFGIIKSYGAGLDQIMSLGAAWIIRPISEWVMIPLFQFLRSFIPNYGVVIIIFSLIIKIALHPLSRTSMKSMKRMQALQPMIEEIREKHKEDPQKMNKQIMQLYKDYGVNPAGGCLPLLLQLPILYALWAVFSSAIELRQASFIWWINDLSIPDIAFTLPFELPIFAVKDMSGLALLMGLTMFIQQKMSVKDPRQKMMVWLMPVFLTLLFNSFPAGLNLYYFVFNLLSIGQQVWINRQHADEPLRKVEEKKKTAGIMNRLAKNLEKIKR